MSIAIPVNDYLPPTDHRVDSLGADKGLVLSLPKVPLSQKVLKTTKNKEWLEIIKFL